MKRRGFLSTLGAAAAAPFLLTERDLAATVPTHPMGSEAITQDGRIFRMGVATRECRAGDLLWVQTYGPTTITIQR